MLEKSPKCSVVFKKGGQVIIWSSFEYYAYEAVQGQFMAFLKAVDVFLYHSLEKVSSRNSFGLKKGQNITCLKILHAV